MKRSLILIIAIFLIQVTAFAQGYNQEQTALKNFLVRMYKTQPFEGVKVVSDYETNYLLSVVLLNKKSGVSETAMNRTAQVKNARQVSQYLDALTVINSETIIKTTEDAKSQQTVEEITDIIKERSAGYTKAMEILAVFDKDEKSICYMFICKVDDMKGEKKE